MTLTATVTGVNPTGTVTFKNGNTLLGSALLTAGTASITRTFGTVGNYTLTAGYNGDTNNLASTSSPLTLTVSIEPQVYYIHTDHLDTPRTITDTGGNVVWQWDNTDPFGANAPNENPNGVGQFSFNLRFAGQYHDRETGLNYNVNRDYSPGLGRYIESDPIGLGGGINPYAYVGGNPLSFIDPFSWAQVGDVAFFNWSGTTWPTHVTLVTQVDANGNATHVFGAWGDTMTFHEVELSRYNGGIQDNIIGYGDMSGLNSTSFQDFFNNWNGRPVAPNWDGSQGQVCIDATTAVDGWGGNTLRNAMRQDYRNNPGSYRDFGAGSANPNNRFFYRRNGWLQQFFQNTKRYQIP